MDTAKQKNLGIAITAVAAASLATALIMHQLSTEAESPFLRSTGLGIRPVLVDAGDSQAASFPRVSLAPVASPVELSTREMESAIHSANAGEIVTVASRLNFGPTVLSATSSARNPESEAHVASAGQAVLSSEQSKTSPQVMGVGEATSVGSRITEKGLSQGKTDLPVTDTVAQVKTPVAPSHARVGWEYPEGRGLPDAGDYVHKLLVMVQEGRWDGLVLEAKRVGIDASCLSVAAKPATEPQPTMPAVLAGMLEPSGQPSEVKRQLEALHYPKYGMPLEPVPTLQGDWEGVFDVTFEALRGEEKPIIALCIGKMSAAELLVVPEFLKRYEGQYSAVIANYDVASFETEDPDDPAARERRHERVSLSLALIHRTVPSVKVWLAVDYTIRWREWISRQAADQFNGIVLCGRTATSKGLDQQVAPVMLARFSGATSGRPVAIMGLEHKKLTAMFSGAGGTSQARYFDQLTAGLRNAGYSFVHVQPEKD